MKARAILEQDKPKDACDLNFCLENFPGRIPTFAAEFATVINDPAVKDRLPAKLGACPRHQASGCNRKPGGLLWAGGENRAFIRPHDLFPRF